VQIPAEELVPGDIVGFEAGDITAVGGTVSGLTATSDPLVYTATFTATAILEGSRSVSRRSLANSASASSFLPNFIYTLARSSNGTLSVGFNLMDLVKSSSAN
jgi:magnesium-transporting ATPase (P-type)